MLRHITRLLGSAGLIVLFASSTGCPTSYVDSGHTGPDYTLIDCDDPRVLAAIPEFCMPR